MLLSRKKVSSLMGVAMAGIFGLSMLTPALAADDDYSDNTGATDVLLASMDQKVIYSSDEEQTVKLNIKLQEAATLCDIQYALEYPKEDGFVLVDATNDDPRILADALQMNWSFVSLNTGKGNYITSDFEDIEDVTEVVTATFTVPANVAPGTYTFGASDVTTDRTYGTVCNLYPWREIYTTLTVLEAEDVTDPDDPYSDNTGATDYLVATMDQKTIYESAEEQTVKLNIKFSPPVSACDFQCFVDYPKDEGVVLTYLENEDARIAPYFSTSSFWQNYNTGLAWYSFSDGLDREDLEEVVTATFTIPANFPAGTYQFGGHDITYSQDYGGIVCLDFVEIYTTLTVLEASETSIPSTDAVITGSTTSLTVGDTTTLTASLQPSDTTETIASTVWSSSSDAVATVSDSGVVTAVAEGTATISADITTSAGSIYTTTYSITVVGSTTPTPTESPYTVKLVPSSNNVRPGDAFTVDVVVEGADFDGCTVLVAYDTSLFTYLDAESDIIMSNINEQTTGNVSVVVINIDQSTRIIDGTTVATLAFKADENVAAQDSGSIGISAGYVADRDIASGDLVSANLGDDVLVTITNQISVTFLEQNGTTTIETYLIDAGGSLTTVPTAPSVLGHDFAGWSDGETTYTDAEILALTFDSSTTYTATYVPSTYHVALGEGLSGADTATYGTNYTGTIDSYSANYEYTITVVVDGGDPFTATVGSDGSFTVDGSKILGDLTVTITNKSVVGTTVEVYSEYVTGYSLVLVYGDATNYSYNGNDMFWVDRYGGAFAYLVVGNVTDTDVNAALDLSNNSPSHVADDYDVNGTGLIDLNDAVTVANCFTVYYDVASNMAWYLHADVNGDQIVDATDVAVMMVAVMLH
ncbi:MAG: Ig-like domain-containing protein [Oscillospiraceae bacterium]|nr:Ig-like domain-containing protein [Oscillospiraceae bacterium]